MPSPREAHGQDKTPEPCTGTSYPSGETRSVTYVTVLRFFTFGGAGIAVFQGRDHLTAAKGYPVDFPPCSVSNLGTVSATSRNKLTIRSLTTQHLGRSVTRS